MKKKCLLFVTILTFSLLVMPIALAKPGAEKSNENFLDFELIITGAADEETGEEWQTPPEPADPKTTHVRDRDWVDAVPILTIDGDTYSEISSPISISYEGAIDVDTNLKETGDISHVRVTEIITFYNLGEEIGTLEISVTDMGKDGFSGTFVAHGTDALKGVKVIGTDAIAFPPLQIVRSGTITNWPY